MFKACKKAPADILLSTAQPPVSLADETQMSSPRTCTPFGVCMCVDAEVCSCLHIKAVCKNAFLLIWKQELIEGERQIWMQNVAESHPTFLETCSLKLCRCAVFSRISDGQLGLGGLHGRRGAHCCGLLPWERMGGVRGVHRCSGIFARADFLLPGVLSSC